jgi:6-pyruvoyltetrahydropterin/6-carboxytetrahydropterin synthase
MYEVSVEERFSASHQLRFSDGCMEPLHAHDWGVRVTVAGSRLDEAGFLVDFGLLRGRLRERLAGLVDQNLNTVSAFDGRNPSAENLAHYIAAHVEQELPSGVRLLAVEVEEEPGCRARFTPPTA